MFQIDETTTHGQRAMQRMETERVVWLTTVRKDGTPQPVPVWFIWTGEQFLIFSQPESLKLKNIERNPRVSLNFNSDENGDDVMIFFGEAILDRSGPPANEVKEYIDKYRDSIRSLDMTPESFAESYSVPIRVKPDYLHGF